MEKVIKEIIYRIVKFLANLTLRAYFRGIDIEGKKQIPSEGPFIYAVNHQNAFLDAIIVGALSPVPTFFMTRSDVFKPPFDWFLDALKMMPIYRIRDGYNKLAKNDAVFSTCKHLLKQKQAILIFPEGNHGLEYYLRPLTKGISRIAMQSQALLNDKIQIIPVGLNYHDHFRSGHKLLIKYGEAIVVNDLMEVYSEHNHKGLLKLTRTISDGMQKTLVIPKESDNYHNEKKVFQRKNEGLGFHALSQLASSATDVIAEKSYPIAGYIGEVFGVLNFPPLLLTNYILKNKVSQKIFFGSIKIAVLILIFPLWFIFCFIVVSIIWSWKIAIAFFILQLVTLIIRRELVRLSH